MSDNYDFIMLTAEGCPHCESAKEGLKRYLDNGMLKTMDVLNEEKALELARQYKVDAVPTIIVNDKKTGIGEACELREDLSGVICKDKEVDF